MVPTPVNRGSTGTRCSACGSYVTPKFLRVFGDNHNEVAACLNCSTMRELAQGASIAD